MDATDVGILERFHARIVSRSKEVARSTERPGGAHDALLASLLKAPVEVCAFCHHARAPGGPWMAVGHLLPAEDGPGVRKTICKACSGSDSA